MKSKSIFMEGNIWFKFRPVGVSIDKSKSITFRGNVVGFISEREFISQKALDKRCAVCVCAYYEGNCFDIRLTDNIAGGAFYAGFVAPGHPCDQGPGATFRNNVAHSVDGVGAWIYPDPTTGGAACFEGSFFAGYKNKRESAGTYFQAAKVIFRDMTSIDNVAGISAQLDGSHIKLERIKIFGETESPDCPEDGGFCVKPVKTGLTSVVMAGGAKPKLITNKSLYPHSKIKGEAHHHARAELRECHFTGFKSKTSGGRR